MKNKFAKIISTLLIFSFLVAAFSVFSFAETTEGEGSEENTENLSIIYNRGYEEGWNYDNGFAYKSISTNTVTVDHEEDSLGKYNYFVRYEATSINAANTRINFGTEAVTHASKNTVGGTVIELSLKADDIAHLGTVVYMTSSVGRDTVKMIDINKQGELVLFNGVSGAVLPVRYISVAVLTQAIPRLWTLTCSSLRQTTLVSSTSTSASPHTAQDPTLPQQAATA